jgi:hypothetical protein
MNSGDQCTSSLDYGGDRKRVAELRKRITGTWSQNAAEFAIKYWENLNNSAVVGIGSAA